MAIIRPFKALRPIPEKAHLVAAVPYDVVNREEAIAKANPLSFLHVSKSEIDLPESATHQEHYDRAFRNFLTLQKEVPLIDEEMPSLYAYRLRIGGHEQLGVVGCFSIDEYDQGLIRRHEKTRKDKEDDRTAHTLALGAHSGPTYLAYRDLTDVDELLKSCTRNEPLYDFTAEDGVSHTIWRLPDSSRIVELFKKVSALYIADGHHRAAASSRARAELSKSVVGTDSDERNYFLAAAFGASQLKVLGYHRLIKDLGGMSQEDFLAQVSKTFEILPFPQQHRSDQVPNPGQIGMYLDHWSLLKPHKKNSGLDVDLLHNELLEPILDIQDPRTNPRIDFVGGIRGTRELEMRVQKGEAAIAFSLHPTSIQEMMELCDRGAMMPPKSTWFEPKLRDGLLIHRL